MKGKIKTAVDVLMTAALEHGNQQAEKEERGVSPQHPCGLFYSGSCHSAVWRMGVA